MLRGWGDGRQTRSLIFIDDCVQGIQINANYDALSAAPISLGSRELDSIDELLTKVERAAGLNKRLLRRYDLEAPKGVAGRNSDNSFIKQVLDWEPTTALDDGPSATYRWISEQYHRRKAGKRVGVG